MCVTFLLSIDDINTKNDDKTFLRMIMIIRNVSRHNSIRMMIMIVRNVGRQSAQQYSVTDEIPFDIRMAEDGG